MESNIYTINPKQNDIIVLECDFLNSSGKLNMPLSDVKDLCDEIKLLCPNNEVILLPKSIELKLFDKESLLNKLNDMIYYIEQQ